MKRLLCCTLAAAMLLFANGCSGRGTTNSGLSSDSTEVESPAGEIALPAETNTAQAENETQELDEFSNTLDPFQGEWEQTDNRYIRLIISGKDLNFVHESSIGEKEYCDVNTFYFSTDEAGGITVVNQYSQPRYNVSIDEKGILTITSIVNTKAETYKKISDSTEVPLEKVEPTIGMTADEVYNSTWGAPQKINRTDTLSGEREQWVYENGYIYLENGYVTSIQEVKP